MADECTLCRIAKGELKVQVVAETPGVMGVLNTLEPFSRGHCVFFPRRHSTNLLGMNNAELGQMLAAIREVAAKTGAENFNVLSNVGSLAGQTVFHAQCT
jgi:histidine triad (HIT) family protein